MIIKHHGWEFTRQLGVGEREHVRQGLLGIGFFHHTDLVKQIEGACRAADELHMMLRAHVNFDRTQDHREILALMRDQFSQHQLETYERPWNGLSRAQFDVVCKRLEIMIVQDVYADSEDLVQVIKGGVLKTWEQSGGRFLKGNFGNLTDEDLKPKYPQFYHDTTRFWEAWNV